MNGFGMLYRQIKFERHRLYLKCRHEALNYRAME